MMKRIRALFLLISASAILFCSGCGSGSSIPSYGIAPSSATGAFNFQTSQLSSAGSDTLTAWGNTTITGNAEGNIFSVCDPSQDANCIVSISPLVEGASGYGQPVGSNSGAVYALLTDSNGRAMLYADTTSLDWEFDANGGFGSACLSGSGFTTYGGGVSGGPQIEITCDNAITNFVATPSSCSLRYVKTGNSYHPVDTCPSTVTLSVEPGVQSTISLPTATALTVADFDSSGTNLAQSTVTASSPATISVPTPATGGTTYIVVYNNSTSKVIGYAPFTYLIQPPPPICPTISSSASPQILPPGCN